jgi:hypothetical protein
VKFTLFTPIKRTFHLYSREITMYEDDYKVVRLLDELLPEAATAQKSGISLDIRLYLSDNGHNGNLWAAVSFIDRDTGKLLKHADNSLPLDSPGAVGWFFNRIAEKGFPLAVQMRTQPRGHLAADD